MTTNGLKHNEMKIPPFSHFSSQIKQNVIASAFITISAKNYFIPKKAQNDTSYIVLNLTLGPCVRLIVHILIQICGYVSLFVGSD